MIPLGSDARGITVAVAAADRTRLEAIAADRNSPQKHVWRARIHPGHRRGLRDGRDPAPTGTSKPCVWRWQERFMRAGVDGLLRDKTRPPGTPLLPKATVERVVELTRQAPPGEAARWTGRTLAAAVGISLSAVQGIWRTHGLVPHRVRTFKLPKDPEFIGRLRDIVGPDLSPPAHAVVLSVDESSAAKRTNQIQALDRIQPGLPMKPDRPATRTHDDVRRGTTTLLAALNILDGTVLGRCLQRHRHQEFLRFLNAIEAAVPAGKVVHAILDNYGAHKHPEVRAWLARTRAGPSTSSP